MSEHNDSNPDDYDTSLYKETKESINQGEPLTTRPETEKTKIILRKYLLNIKD
jgi:hypothetical protein